MSGPSRAMHISAHTSKAAASGWRRVRAAPLQACARQPNCAAATGSLTPHSQLQPSSLRPWHSASAIPGAARHPSFGAYLPSLSVRGARHARAHTPLALPQLLSSIASSPYRDYIIVAGAAVGAAIWVKIFNVLASNGTLEQKLSRKLVHTTTGPIFVLTWALFSNAPVARVLAAAVPLANFARLVAVGSGLINDPGLVKSVSRSGDKGELLKGPTYYCVTLIAATVLCWRDNPAGLIAVAMMCGGDGLADIVGRRWGGAAKLPYNSSKSWAGSAAMLVGGYVLSYGLIVVFCSLGFFSCYPAPAMLSCLGTIALAATVVESLPINQYIDDNVSVPGVAALLSLLLLPQPVEAVATAAAAAAAELTAAPAAAAAVELAAAAAPAAAVASATMGIVL